MKRFAMLTLALSTALFGQAALADTWTRSGPRMDVERTYTGSGSATVSRDFESGATSSRSTTCDGNPWLATCSTTLDVQTSGGNAYTLERNAAATRYRGGSVTTITGPSGNTYVSPRRWRR